MFRSNWVIITAAASVGSGLLWTFVSGLYIIKPLILDVEELYYGFPLPWLQAARSLWGGLSPWSHFLLWKGLVLDFMFYASLSAIVTACLLRITRTVLSKREHDSR